jgi:poly-gamma-glutamate synthesis protein (capsule biosynthesis protein)
MRRLAALLLPLVLLGCTEEAAPVPPSDRDSTSPSPDSPGTPETSPPLEPIDDDATEPLVLAVHPTRSVDPVRTVDAHRLLEDGGERWARIGQPGESMRVVTGGLPDDVQVPGAVDAPSPQAALAQVRRRTDTLALVPASSVDARVRVLSVGGIHPLRSPGEYRFKVPAEESPRAVVTLTVVGDVMLGRTVGDALVAADDPSAVLRPLGPRLRSADITVGNFESTLSTNGEAMQPGDDSFAAAPNVRQGLHLAGFDVLSLGNNHAGDYGPVAMEETFDLLDDFSVVGAGRNLREARRPVTIERDGVRVGFYATDSIGETPAATARTPGTNRLDMPPRTGPLDRVALGRVAGDVRALAARVDTVVVLPHWGEQYTHVPEPIQSHVARVFARSGADLVLGGHPHWVQGWESVRGVDGVRTTVVHSLGNFIFDMDHEEAQQGLFVEVVMWDGEVMAVEPVPYVIGDDYAPRRVSGDVGLEILSDAWSTSGAPWGR